MQFFLQIQPFQKIIVNKISHGRPIDYVNLRKIDLKLIVWFVFGLFFGFFLFCFFAILWSCNLFYKNCLYFISYPSKFWSKKNIIELYGHVGPLWGHDPIFFKFFSCSSFIFLSIQMSLGDYFSFNLLNGHYLYPPFFPIQRLTRKKGPLRGRNSLKC